METDVDELQCSICMHHKVGTIIVDCSHICMCVECSLKLVQQKNVGEVKCPICYADVKEIKRIYIP